MDRSQISPSYPLVSKISACENLIREGKEHPLYTVMQTAKNIGMHTTDTSLHRLFTE